MAMEYSIPIPPDQWLSGIEYSMASPPDSCFQAKDTLSRTYFPCTIWISSPDSAGPSELQDIHPPVQQLYSEYLTERCGRGTGNRPRRRRFKEMISQAANKQYSSARSFLLSWRRQCTRSLQCWRLLL